MSFKLSKSKKWNQDILFVQFWTIFSFVQGKSYTAKSGLLLKSIQLIIETLLEDELFDSYVEWTNALHDSAKSRGVTGLKKIQNQIQVAKEIHDRMYHSITYLKNSKDFR